MPATACGPIVSLDRVYASEFLLTTHTFHVRVIVLDLGAFPFPSKTQIKLQAWRNRFNINVIEEFYLANQIGFYFVRIIFH